jgi:hypothetical protein
MDVPPAIVYFVLILQMEIFFGKLPQAALLLDCYISTVSSILLVVAMANSTLLMQTQERIFGKFAHQTTNLPTSNLFLLTT